MNQSMIEFRNLCKSFGNRQILKGLSLRILESEIVFVLGTSGTGKSVLLKTLVGLMRADSGEIWIDGQEVSQISEENYLSIRKKCGMVFQQPALFDSLTIFENVAFGLRRHFQRKTVQGHPMSENEIAARVEKALDEVHLQNLGHKKPSEISYGMQKRVSLARTIALEPKILLFDEPTTGLDPVTTQSINLLIQELSRTLRTTSVVVSHDMQCALAIADRIIVLDQGHMIAEETPLTIKNCPHPLVQDFMREVLP
ncbi:MAG TPA: ABC transporter ATP-binding protein [Pseudobdellovibrionaceae bacterium]|nr:ABC transporter ATP-binding protein [Pseudobdellovibrionaceae bacterium]